MWSFLVAFSAPALAGELTFAPAADAATEVRWADGSPAVVLEKFPAAEDVIGSEVSADGRLAFAWHQPKGKSLRVSVYDLQTKQRLSSFSPGYGGELHFSAANTLVLEHGCGTSCAVMDVFDSGGKALVSIGGGATEMSPTRKYAIEYASTYSDPGPVTLIDLASGAVLVRSSATEAGDVGVDVVKWAIADASVVLSIVAREGGSAAPRYLRLAPDGTAAWVAAP